MNSWRKFGVIGIIAGLMVAFGAGCSSATEISTGTSRTASSADSESTAGSDAAADTSSPESTQPAATTTESESTTADTAAPTTTSAPASGGDAALAAPDEVGAYERFEVDWTGPDAQGDYITIVAAGAVEWSNEPYFYTAGATSPGSLPAPGEGGEYSLWYVAGETDEVLARRAIIVLPFEGALGAPDEVEAGSEFEVAWNGPNGPGDYVTIVAEGSTEWTGEVYFYTSAGSPGTLVAPVEPGDYELWYVTGADDATMASRPITVTPAEVTLEAPESVDAESTFEVTWTGPDGPQDYITIVPAGSPEGTFLSYAYTANGSPAVLTAPTDPGDYEIWYASDRVEGVFASIDIVVD